MPPVPGVLMPNKNSDDYRVKSAAAALIKADQFVTVLEELRKGGDAVKYNDRPQKAIITSPVAVVTVDGQSLTELLRQRRERPDNIRYEIVLGTPSGLVKNRITEKIRYVDYKYLGEGKFAEEGNLTGWRPHLGEVTYSLAFGGHVHSKSAYIIHFVPADFYVPAAHSSSSIQRSLKANKDFGGFTAPKTFGDETLAMVAKGLHACLNRGVAFKPKVQLQPSPRWWIPIDSIGDPYIVDIYVLSDKAHSKLEKICEKGLELF